MRAAAERAVLRHRLVGRRHLNRRIHVAIQLQASERFEVRGERLALRPVIVALGVGIPIELRCSMPTLPKRLNSSAVPINGSRAACRRPSHTRPPIDTETARKLQEMLRPLAHVGVGRNPARQTREGLRKDRVVDDNGGASCTKLVECASNAARVSAVSGGRRGGAELVDLGVRYRGGDAVEGNPRAIENELRYAKTFSFQRVGLEVRDS